MSPLSLSSSVVVFSNPIFDLCLGLGVAGLLLLIGTGVFAIRKRFQAAVEREAQRLYDEEQAQQDEVRREKTYEDDLLCLSEQEDHRDELLVLQFACTELRYMLCGTSEELENDLLLISQQKGEPYNEPEPLEHFRALAIELAALQKILSQCEQWLADGLLVKLDFFHQWREELKARFVQQSKQGKQQQVFAPSQMAALQNDAQEFWRDLIASISDTRRPFLLQLLQEAIIEHEVAMADTRRYLVGEKPLANWIAPGPYRSVLIQWSMCHALRSVLDTRSRGLDLTDSWVKEYYFRAFAQALARKCDADQQLLYQELHAEKRSTASNVLLVVSPCKTVYHSLDPLAMFFPSPASWLEDRERQFRRVAEVSAPLDEVFELTNHVDQDYSWTSNPEVLWHTAENLRSTSVGDVIVAPDGRAWMVMPVGLEEIVPSTPQSSQLLSNVVCPM